MISDSEIAAQRKIIEQCDIPHKVARFNDFVCMFREPGKLKVDFVPGAQKWRIFVKGSKRPVYKYGSAKEFIAWYKTYNRGNDDDS